MKIDLSIDAKAVHAGLVRWLKNQFERNGFSKSVLGLSGGLDSALVCYLLVDALGAENVLPVRMPYKSSASHSMDDAQKVIDATGVPHLDIPVTPMVDPLIKQFSEMSKLRQGNIMARQRMIILFDQSAAVNGLVVGTGNKTEIFLGYSTIYGDGAYAMNPVGDLYKTQIRQLSAYLGVPESILAKPPSADLWQGQTDEGDLGFTYADVDQLLYLLLDKKLTPNDCEEAGFSGAFIHAVLKKIERSRFKREMPPIARIKDILEESGDK